jgi:peptidoglycan/LPS O-acetylase OafA/YrhL
VNLRFAFSLFLVHYTLIKLVFAVWPVGGLSALVLSVITSNLVAWAFAQATEAHYRKLAAWLRQRLFPRLPKVDNPMENSKP